MSKVSLEIASDNIKQWLDSKKIPQNKRDSYQGMIDNLVSSVAEGNLMLMEDMKLKHILVFPLTDENGTVILSELTYRNRLSDANLEPYRKTIKGNTFEDSLKRTILALTGQALGYINLLDASTDRQIAESIAVFFV